MLQNRATIYRDAELLANYLRAQFIPALQGDDDIALEDRREARLLVAKLALMRGETYAATLADILDA